MTTAPMRTVLRRSISTSSRWKKLLANTSRILIRHDVNNQALVPSTTRSLTQVREENLSELWFTASFPANAPQATRLAGSNDVLMTSPTSGRLNTHLNVLDRYSLLSTGSPSSSDSNPPSERTLALGRTLRKLTPLLPTILTSPLPPEILSPHVSLHLFPSTHPHLPVVKGKIAYRAALWTAPVAWGSVPVVGNVKLEILSEKIVRAGYISAPTLAQSSDNAEDGDAETAEEKLVVKWRTIQNSTTTSPSQTPPNNPDGINHNLSTLLGGDRPLFPRPASSTSPASNTSFSGLFVFTFDAKGKIVDTTIEHSDQANGEDKTSRVVTVADWLLGKAKWKTEEQGLVPGLACRVNIVEERRLRGRRSMGWR